MSISSANEALSSWPEMIDDVERLYLALLAPCDFFALILTCKSYSIRFRGRFPIRGPTALLEAFAAIDYLGPLLYASRLTKIRIELPIASVAARTGSLEILKWFIAQKAKGSSKEIDTGTRDHLHLMRFALAHGQLRVVEYFANEHGLSLPIREVLDSDCAMPLRAEALLFFAKRAQRDELVPFAQHLVMAGAQGDFTPLLDFCVEMNLLDVKSKRNYIRSTQRSGVIIEWLISKGETFDQGELEGEWDMAMHEQKVGMAKTLEKIGGFSPKGELMVDLLLTYRQPLGLNLYFPVRHIEFYDYLLEGGAIIDTQLVTLAILSHNNDFVKWVLPKFTLTDLRALSLVSEALARLLRDNHSSITIDLSASPKDLRSLCVPTIAKDDYAILDTIIAHGLEIPSDILTQVIENTFMANDDSPRPDRIAIRPDVLTLIEYFYAKGARFSKACAALCREKNCPPLLQVLIEDFRCPLGS